MSWCLCLSSKFSDLNNENKDKCSWLLFIKYIKNNVSKESKLNIVAYLNKLLNINNFFLFL